MRGKDLQPFADSRAIAARFARYHCGYARSKTSASAIGCIVIVSVTCITDAQYDDILGFAHRWLDETSSANVKERAMLWAASLMKGYVVSGIDGKLGTTTDLLFDDTN